LIEGKDAIHSYFARLADSGDKVAIDALNVIMLHDDAVYVSVCDRALYVRRPSPRSTEDDASRVHYGPGQAGQRLANCSPSFFAPFCARFSRPAVAAISLMRASLWNKIETLRLITAEASRDYAIQGEAP
jgi:hypothetical protein